MSAIWNLEETRQLIKVLYGEQQLALANPSLNSVLERRNHASIHWHNIRSALQRFQRQAQKTPLFALAFSGDKKVSGKYWLDEAKVQAYSIALVQSLHAIPDIYAHAIYYSLHLNKGPSALEERRINAAKVRDKLTAEDVSRLKALFSHLFEGEHAKHLAAISNLSKHRSVVKASLNEDYTEPKERVKLVFPKFMYDGKEYASAPCPRPNRARLQRCREVDRRHRQRAERRPPEPTASEKK
jgi:hypothetical protein